MAAAYLFALQGILGGTALTHQAATAGNGPVICYGDRAQNASTTPDSLPGRIAACAVCALAFAPATVPPSDAAIAVRYAVDTEAAPTPPPVAPTLRQPTPRMSQGPPAHA